MRKFHKIIISYLIPLTISAFHLQTVSASDKNWNLMLTPHAGLNCGTINEFLYSSENENTIVSRLDWKENVLWNVGINASYSYKNFFVSGGFDYNLPFECGKMIDSDFSGELTKNKCFFQNTIPLGFDASLELKYRFSLSQNIDIFPAVKCIYAKRNFKSKNGYGYFGDSEYSKSGATVRWDSEYARKASKVSDIKYNQDFFYTFTGLQTDILINRFTLSLGLYFSPFSFCSAEDIHLKFSEEKSYFTKTKMPSYFAHYMADFKASCCISNFFSVFIDISGLYGTFAKSNPLTDQNGKIYGNVFDSSKKNDYLNQKSNSSIKEFKIKTGCQFIF